MSPFLVPMMMANSAGAAISMRYGLQGPNETVCTACAAGTHAIGNAALEVHPLIGEGIALALQSAVALVEGKKPARGASVFASKVFAALAMHPLAKPSGR